MLQGAFVRAAVVLHLLGYSVDSLNQGLDILLLAFAEVALRCTVLSLPPRFGLFSRRLAAGLGAGRDGVVLARRAPARQAGAICVAGGRQRGGGQ